MTNQLAMYNATTLQEQVCVHYTGGGGGGRGHRQTARLMEMCHKQSAQQALLELGDWGGVCHVMAAASPQAELQGRHSQIGVGCRMGAASAMLCHASGLPLLPPPPRRQPLSPPLPPPPPQPLPQPTLLRLALLLVRPAAPQDAPPPLPPLPGAAAGFLLQPRLRLLWPAAAGGAKQGVEERVGVGAVLGGQR